MNCIKKKCKGKCPCPEGCDWNNFDSVFCDYYENAFCGSDNITYRSNCEFSTAKCESLGLYGVELTGYSLSEVLIFTSINPKYDNRLFIDLQVQYKKTTSSVILHTLNCYNVLFTLNPTTHSSVLLLCAV